jgi:signal transduction histidine kinase
MTDDVLLRTVIAIEHDVFVVRQQGREVARLLGMEGQDQSRVATALSEVGRLMLAALGPVGVVFRLAIREPSAGIGAIDIMAAPGAEFASAMVPMLEVRASCAREPANHANHLGDLELARPLMDRWAIETSDSEIAVVMARRIPAAARRLGPADLRHIRAELTALAPLTPLQELAVQNRQLLTSLEEIQAQRDDLLRLNAELEETNRGVMALYNQLTSELEATNRGVVALYAELDEKSAQLRAASEAKSRFLANVSHELRAPAAAVLGLLRLLFDPESDPLTEEQRHQLDLIRGSAEDLLTLVNTLLDLAKAESGRLEPQLAPVDLAAIFATLGGTLGSLAANPDVSLIVEEPAGVPPILSDEVMLTQILRNLLTNALKFTRRGEVRLWATFRTGAGVVDFDVEDTGLGIPAEEQERIFEEFYQGSTAAHGNTKGTGLGLSFARRLATLLGGSLTVASTPGVGSRFTVSLPATPLAAMGDVDGYTVLVVEDDDAFRAAVAGVMRGVGAHVVEAADGRAALEAIAAERPDVVLLDLRLPEVDGKTVLDSLADDDNLRDIPVVVLTAFTHEVMGDASLPRAAAVLGKANTALDSLPTVVRSALRGGLR